MDPSTTLSLTVTFAVIAAAVTHAAWNAIAHGIKDQTLAFALIGVGGTAVGIPLVIVAAMPRADCWPYLLGSVAIHVFYNLLLMRCYRLGEFGQVYPLARGTSPLVVTILAAIFIREHLALPQIAGVLVVSAGLATLVLAGRRPGRAAFLAAVGTGLTIAAYTTVDGVGVRLSASPVGYIGWLMVLESLCVPMFALARRRDVLLKQPKRILLSRPGRRGAERARLRIGAVGADTGRAGPDRRAPRDQRDLRRDHRHADFPRAVRTHPYRRHRAGGGGHRAAEPQLGTGPGIGGCPAAQGSAGHRADGVLARPLPTQGNGVNADMDR